MKVYGRLHRVNMLRIGPKMQYMSDRTGNTKLLYRTKFCDGKKRSTPYMYYANAKDFVANTEHVSRNSPTVHRYLMTNRYKSWLAKKESVIEKITGKPITKSMSSTPTTKTKSAYAALSRQREKYFISSTDTKTIKDEDLLAIVSDADRNDIVEPMAFANIGSWADIEDDM